MNKILNRLLAGELVALFFALSSDLIKTHLVEVRERDIHYALATTLDHLWTLRLWKCQVKWLPPFNCNVFCIVYTGEDVATVLKWHGSMWKMYSSDALTAEFSQLTVNEQEAKRPSK